MLNKISRWFQTLNYPSYVVFFVTAKCNANCKMCFYKDNMAGSAKVNELTVEEYDKISQKIKLINVLGISGGEPFLRNDLSEIIKVVYKNCRPLVVDLPTNGFFTESVLRQAEDIAKNCPDMVVDLQISIDGPEKIHNEIRGLKDGFSRMKETYRGLVNLKNKYKNLKVKACVVYSHYNEKYIEELFEILNRDFKDLDRIVFSVVHGSVSNTEAFQFDWNKYFSICDKIQNKFTVKSAGDFHSLFTIALRMAKNDFLKKILKTKDMYKNCQAGKRVIIVGETGKVFPCEPLWQAVGDLRSNGYDINSVINSVQMKKFNEQICEGKCDCHWGLALSNALLYKPSYYPKILSRVIAVYFKSLFSKRK